MTKNIISRNLSRLEFAAEVVKQLGLYNITCVLVGGSCVSIYTHEKYASDDLDFISPYSQSAIKKLWNKLDSARMDAILYTIIQFSMWNSLPAHFL